MDSIYRNTYKNLEIICVNDGSTDGSLEILKAQTDERVVVIDKTNGGVSSARNAGMKAATGEYIAFVDPDDWVHSRYFEYLMRAIDGCDIACCSFQKICEQKDEEIINYHFPQVYTEEEAERIRDVRDKVWGRIYTRVILENMWFRNEIEICEDKVFNLEVFISSCRVAVVPLKLYFYFMRPGPMVHTYGTKLLPPARVMFNLMRKTKRLATLEQTYSMLLSCRYMNMFQSYAREIRLETNEMLRACEKQAKFVMPSRKRVVYHVFVRFPVTYRFWRILLDRTLIEYERSEKRRKKLISGMKKGNENGFN